MLCSSFVFFASYRPRFIFLFNRKGSNFFVLNLQGILVRVQIRVLGRLHNRLGYQYRYLSQRFKLLRLEKLSGLNVQAELLILM